MIGEAGDGVILREGAKTGFSQLEGQLVAVGDLTSAVFFEGRGTVAVPNSWILPKKFSKGDEVVLLQDTLSLWGPLKKGGSGVIKAIATDGPEYSYAVEITPAHTIYCKASQIGLKGVSMNIAELARHLIAGKRDVPVWFKPVAEALKDLPDLSSLQHDQMEFIIRRHMENRRIDTREDLVANVMFDLRVSAGHNQIHKLAESLHDYKAKLIVEWKKLGRIVPIEFQYAALRAYAETRND